MAFPLPSPAPAPRLAARVGALALATPLLTASGAYGAGGEYVDFLDLSVWGGVVAKSVTPGPTRGNPPPRVAETPSGMLNAVGLQNDGVGHFIRELLPPLRARARRVIANVAGKSVEDYLHVVRALDPTPVDALEINISCPNVKEGGIAFGVDPAAAAGLTAALRAATAKPLWVKLSPNVTDISVIARAVSDAGADAVVVANTYIGMMVDIERRRPILANVTGGLSGPCVFPLTLRLVWQAARAVKTPVVACGGVTGVREAVAYLLAGARAVEVGTMNFVEPALGARIAADLDAWLADRGETVEGIVGTLALTPD